MPKNLVVDCTCGGSFFCNEDELKKSLYGVKTCNNLYGPRDNPIRCNKQYSYLRLLKIMQVTNYWHAADEKIYAQSENVDIDKH
jgi:hypothetical protein